MKRWRFYIRTMDNAPDDALDAQYEFEAPNEDMAVHIGRGMAFIDGWCCEGTQSHLEELP